MLVNHVEVMEQKQKDQHQAYVQEVARLTRKCIQFETDKAFMESDFTHLQVNFQSPEDLYTLKFFKRKRIYWVL